VKLSTQLYSFARQIIDGEAKRINGTAPLVIDVAQLVGALQRLGRETETLELQLESTQSSLSSEFIMNAITNARLVLVTPSAPEQSRQLAEAVLALAGRTNPN
jgi:hypothetical protein